MYKHLASIALVAIAITCSQTVFAQGYGGPSMLSRGGNRPGHRGRSPVGIVVYGAVRGTAYETGLTPVRLDEGGTLAQDQQYGYQAEIGAYGTRSWKRTTLGLDYRGDYRYNSSNSNYNGLNQAIAVDIIQTLSRRNSIFLREVGGTTNRAFGAFIAPAVPDPFALNLVNDEVFDTRTYFSQTSVGTSYRSSARMNHTVVADYFFTKRPDPRLVSVTGYRGLASTQYVLNSRSSIGGFYEYMQFRYPRVYGGSDINGLGVNFSRRLTRNMDLSLTGGALQVRTYGTQTVRLSPEVAAILGRLTGVEAFRRTDWVPQIAVTLGYALERSRFTGSFISGISPGNGVYLTSQRNIVSAGYSFAGIRKLSMGVSARYSNLVSKSITVTNMNTIGGGGGVNYRLTRHLNLSSQFDFRHYSSGGVPGREGYYVAIGLSFSPTPVPVSIW